MYYKIGVLMFVAQLCTALALPPCVCTRNFRPVCGSDGKTYSNVCILNCERSKGNSDLTVDREGSCEPPQRECICPFNYAPVCGTDGNSYPNYCSLNCARSTSPSLDLKYQGECKDEVKVVDLPSCTCTRDMQPVCGSDGNTYNNPCLLNCATAANSRLSIAHEGPCDDVVKVVDPTADISCACTRNLKPVCGSDGLTYNNPCLLNCASASNPQLSITHEGHCDNSVKVVDSPNYVPSCACTRNLRPVCGSDGNTYSNPCLLNCATAGNPSLAIAHDGSCDESVKVVEQPLPDQQPNCSCTRNLEPVCGSDGKTYNNECLLNCAGPQVTLVRHEPCELVNVVN